MQIVIPMSGFGERFRKAGYTLPKPLIVIDGKPIIAHVIDMFPGETDFLLKIVAKDWESYEEFLTTKLTPAKNVSQVKSALSFRSAKQSPGVPIDLDADTPPGC